jgi:GntR family transcriptional regulator/MocR family aminotransferase
MLRPWHLELRLDHNSEKAIYLQIADAIIADIQSGRLKSGTALPSSRHMAEMLNINRNTVVEAVNVLLNEEWIVSKQRKGCFVSDVLPTTSRQRKTPSTISETALPTYRIQFDDGAPDSKISPIAELARSYRQIFNQNGRWQLMGYGNPLGDTAFRTAIVQMLNLQRGMSVNIQSVCVTRGSQMAMYLLSQCFFDKGDNVVVENPGYKPAWKAFELAGANLLPVRVDSEGLVVEDVVNLLHSRKKIRAVYTTPHHQYPTTVTLSLQRRMELMRLSNEYGFMIIEDDYDNEFHYGYRPILPISSFRELKKYAYIGTMSKVVAPALRIGYLASNDESLVRKVGELRKIVDVQGDLIMEQAVLQLINDGTIKKHIRKSTNHYKAKRDFTLALLDKYLKGKASYHIPEGGLAFWIVPAAPTDWQAIAALIIGKGIKILIPDYYHGTEEAQGLRLSYGSVSEESLKETIKVLSQVLKFPKSS